MSAWTGAVGDQVLHHAGGPHRIPDGGRCPGAVVRFGLGHLLFAATATGYILVGIAFEERDLKLSLGETYTSYRARVPALIPRPSARSQPSTEHAGGQMPGSPV